MRLLTSIQLDGADSNGGRQAYTLDEINAGALDDAVVLNSISDSKIGHEFNFVGAKENNGDTDAYVNANEIAVKENATYFVRLYVHNNSRISENVAEGVRVRFRISDTKYVRKDELYEVAVHGYITSSNANPEWYSDGVKFTADRPFHLEYILGTALFQNCGIGSKENGCWSLDDSITNDWVSIGYDAMNGRIPACFQYDSVTTIKVMPVFD